MLLRVVTKYSSYIQHYYTHEKYVLVRVGFEYYTKYFVYLKVIT